ncbi:hypothetical protein PENTCL1PPCAC_9195, partial [Pristionchus entomophagus]
NARLRPKMTRACLVCGKPTRFAHSQVDACRACAVFYGRRKEEGQPLVCRSGTNKCDISEGGKKCCRKCRFDRFEALLKASCSSTDTLSGNTNPKPQDENSCGPSNEGPQLNASSSTVDDDPTTIKTNSTSDLQAIAALRRGYTLMNAMRRSNELSSRANYTGPHEIYVDDMIIIPTTHELIESTTRILVSSMYAFAYTAFPEFNSFTRNEQWQLIRNFYPFICMLDSEYRMLKLFSNEETMSLASYATYYDHHTIALFMPDHMTQDEKDAAKILVSDLLDGEIRKMRAKMRRWNPTENEFIAFIGISFWTLDKVTPTEEIHRTAEKYRRMIFQGLEKMYQEELHLSEYACRMGEAVLFLGAIQNSFAESHLKFGILKLLNVIGEEKIVAQLM